MKGLRRDLASNASASCHRVLQTTCEHVRAGPWSAMHLVSSGNATFPKLIRSGLGGRWASDGARPLRNRVCTPGTALADSGSQFGGRRGNEWLQRVSEASRRSEVALTDELSEAFVSVEE